MSSAPSSASSSAPSSASSSAPSSASSSAPSSSDAVTPTATVIAVSTDDAHRFSKPNRDRIHLLAGLGVEGDSHLGLTVQHRSRVARDPTTPNLRQIHLIQSELHDELNAAGFTVGAGDMGENVTTRGIDLLALPTGTHLHLGGSAVIEITGLRNPCGQIDKFQQGMTRAVLDRDAKGKLIRKAGVMGVVLAGGDVRPGDRIAIVLPAEPHLALEPV